MTEYELIAAYQSVEASWQGAVSIFISILFAYLATAYFAGAKLARSQVVIVTGLYTVFSLIMLQMLATLLRRMTQLGSEILALSPERAVAGGRGLPIGLVLWGSVFIGAYVAGLVFMFQVRRNARGIDHRN
jgi:branched-subunit amino acid ABC-type transport system permease component